MQEDILIPLGLFAMIVAWVGFVQIGSTIRHYLDWRLRMAERQVGGGEGGVLRAIQELRAEIAALKREESEAVLSFDSTLQTMDARLKNLERRSLGGGSGERVPVTPSAGEPAQEVTAGR